jgi:hypothetical protein
MEPWKVESAALNGTSGAHELTRGPEKRHSGELRQFAKLDTEAAVFAFAL